MIRPKGKKYLFLPLLLIIPGAKLLSSGYNFFDSDLYLGGIFQSLKPPVSKVFELDLNDKDVRKFSALWMMKELKKQDSKVFSKYVDAPRNINRGGFITKFCTNEGKYYGLYNLMTNETKTKPSLDGHYTKQLLNLLKEKKHLDNEHMNILKDIIRNWDSTHKINLSDLKKMIYKLKELKSTVSEPFTGTLFNRAYWEYDAINISFQITMAVLFDLVKDKIN